MSTVPSLLLVGILAESSKKIITTRRPFQQATQHGQTQQKQSEASGEKNQKHLKSEIKERVQWSVFLKIEFST